MKNKPRSIKWGIIGLGKIAHKFASDLNTTEGCKLGAVASRTLVKAEAFAMEFGVSHAYGTYKEMAESADVDAVYIATPHTMHMEDSLLCLKNGKAVLCEKPLALNLEQVNKMVAVAKNENVLLMEALWTRFLPSFQFVKDTVDSGELGKIISMKADFGFVPNFDPKQRLFNKSLGGGSLLDIGIYPVFLALSLLGKPKNIQAEATFFETGADSSVDMEFDYSEAIKVNLNCTLLEETPTRATIKCEGGTIIMESRFHEPTSIINTQNGESETHDFPTENHGYNFEILHFNQLIRNGKTESDLMDFEFSQLLSSTLDSVKEIIGLRYS